MLETLDNYEVKESASRQLVTGPIAFRPVLVNPTRAQLNEFYGTDKKTDMIEYFGSKDIQGTPVDNLRIQFYGFFTGVDGKEYKGAIDPFWVTNKLWESNKTEVTKYCWINPYGRTSWTDLPEHSPLDSWYRGSARKSYMGEESLMNFILALLGINTYYDSSLDQSKIPTYITNGETFLDINKLFSKDYSELQALITKYCSDESVLPVGHANRNRKIAVIASVKNRNDNNELQQTYYMSAFAKVNKDVINKKDVERLITTINKEASSEYGWKHNGSITSTLAVFNPTAPFSTEGMTAEPGW